MRPPTISIAIDGEDLNQNSFFRHDFVLAAIAADFEGGGVIEGGEQRVSASVLREAEARIFYDSAKVSYQDLERI